MQILCDSTRLAEGEAIGIDNPVPGERGFILARRGGRVYAYINRCPHTGVNLEWIPGQFLDSSGQYLQCALHGAMFEFENGLCVRGPCAGDALAAVPVAERDGKILLVEG